MLYCKSVMSLTRMVVELGFMTYYKHYERDIRCIK